MCRFLELRLNNYAAFLNRPLEFRHVPDFSTTKGDAILDKKITEEQALEFHAGQGEFGKKGMEAAQLAAEMAGERKFVNFLKNFLGAYDVMRLNEIKEHQVYRNLIDHETGKPHTWDTYCEKALSVSRRVVDDQIGLLNRYGEDCIHAIAALKIGGRKVRMLLSAPVEFEGKLLDASLSPEAERVEKMQAVLDEMAAQLGRKQTENEQLGHTLDQKLAEIDKRKTSEARAEDTIRILTKKNRELESGWSPSADATEAIEQLEQINGTIGQQFAKITLLLARAGHHPEVRAHLMGILQADYDIEDGRVAQCRGDLAEKMNEHARKAAKGKA